MLKNNKGFTLIELIAVVTIMAIIALIATPNIISMIDNGNKEKYISDAKDFISKASYMYNLDKYKSEEEKVFESTVNGSRINLENIEKLDEMEDPYGNKYDYKNSYIVIRDETVNDVMQRRARIYLISCDKDEPTKCYRIGDVENPVLESDLNNDSVEKVK